MKKLFVELGVFLLCLALFILPLIGFCKKCHMCYDVDDYCNYQFVFHTATHGPKSYKTIILGDSRMMSFFNPNFCSNSKDSVVNLSLPGGSPIEAYYVLKRYLSAGRKLEKVIVGFDPGHLTGTQIIKQAIPFDVFEKKELDEIYGCLISDSCFDAIERQDIYGYYYGYLPLYGYRLINAGLFFRFSSNQSIMQDVVKNKGNKIYTPSEYDWWERNKVHELEVKLSKKAFKICIPCDEYLKKIIKTCLANSIGLVIEQTPVAKGHPIYNELFWHEYNKYLDELSKSYPSIHVVKHIPVYEPIMFNDLMHASSLGCTYYTHSLSRKYNL